MLTFNERRQLEEEMCNVIDSSWHYSWHWPRNQYGGLTLEGLRNARNDAASLLAERERHAKSLREIITRIDSEIAEEVARSDIQEAEHDEL